MLWEGFKAWLMFTGIMVYIMVVVVFVIILTQCIVDEINKNSAQKEEEYKKYVNALHEKAYKTPQNTSNT